MNHEAEPLKALENLERLFTSKTVVGEPFQVDGTTIVPLLSVGIMFGGGEGTNANGKAGGEGTGYGGGGGVRPIALIISNKDGVRVERLVGAMASTVEGIVDAVSKSLASKGEQPKIDAGRA